MNVRALLYVLVLPSLAACAATRHSFGFEPAPAAFTIDGEDGKAIARGLASVVEGRVTGTGDDRRNELVVRLRLVNVGPGAISVESAELVGSDVRAFGAPNLSGIVVPPGEEQTWDIGFAYPPGADLALDDLTGVHLTLVLHGGTRRAQVDVAFSRFIVVAPSSPAWGFSLGVGVHD